MVPFGVSTFVFSSVIVVDVLLILVGSVNIACYWTVKPDKEQPFESIRSFEREYRSVVWPAFAALVTGLLISLSASFLYVEFTETERHQFPTGIVLFLVACSLFVLFLRPVLNGEAPLEKLARYPQRILAAALAVSGDERDASATLDTLRVRADAWQRSAGAFSLGWTNTEVSPELNAALGGVRPHAALPIRDAFRSVWFRGAHLAAWRTAPWRFGWPTYIVVVSHGSMIVVQSLAGNISPGLVVLVLVGGVAVWMYQLGVLLPGARRLAIGRHFLGRCEKAIIDASQRIDAVNERHRHADALPITLSGLDRRVAELTGELRRSRWICTVGLIVPFAAGVFVARRGGRQP